MHGSSKKQLTRRQVKKEVRDAVKSILVENRNLDCARFSQQLVPKAGFPAGWNERSAASWGAVLKLVERRLRLLRPEYRLLNVVASDGHQTWNLPVSAAIHLLTEKILAGYSILHKLQTKIQKL